MNRPLAAYRLKTTSSRPSCGGARPRDLLLPAVTLGASFNIFRLGQLVHLGARTGRSMLLALIDSFLVRARGRGLNALAINRVELAPVRRALGRRCQLRLTPKNESFSSLPSKLQVEHTSLKCGQNRASLISIEEVDVSDMVDLQLQWASGSSLRWRRGGL